jgi:hypothetical protein
MKSLAKFEPIRLYVYGLVGPISMAIIGFGLYDRQKTLLIAGVVLVALTVPAAESARSKVTPVEKTVLTGNLVNDVRYQMEQGAGMILQQAASSLPGLIRPMVENSINQAITDSQMPTESVPSGKVDGALLSTESNENPYA